MNYTEDQLKNLKESALISIKSKDFHPADQIILKLIDDIRYLRIENIQLKEQDTLAEKCYRSDRANDELFSKIHHIMGGESFIKCNEEGFVFPCSDCWADGYDGSVEILVQRPLTQEEANQILALGFACIYESPTGVDWTKLGKGPCSTREGDEERSQLFKARAQRDALLIENKALKDKAWMYDELCK